MERYVVITEYNTDADGKEIPADKPGCYVVTGPFNRLATAKKYMDNYPDDTDVRDMVAVPLNPARL